MFERIFVRCPNWVGDLVMATPALRALRERHPRAHIAYGLRPYLQPVLRGADTFDELIPLPRARGLSQLLAQARALNRRAFGLALNFPGSWEAALLVTLAAIPERYGFGRGGAGVLLSESLRPPRFRGRRVPRPMVFVYADLVGLADAIVLDHRPELARGPQDDAAWEARRRAAGMDPERPYAILNPGASYGSSKFWSVEGFAGLATGLARGHGLQSAIAVGPGEEELARGIAAAAEVPVFPMLAPILDLHGLKSAVAGAAVLVTTDTGTRHYGTAFGIPTVVLIGPTDARFTAANLERTVVVRRDLPCAPCHRKSCPLGHHRCMLDIRPAEVLAAVDELLSEEAAS